MVKEIINWLYKIIKTITKEDSKLCIIASSSRLFPTASVKNNLNDPYRIRIGTNTYIRGELLTFAHGGEIIIGDYCYIGENSRIWSGCLIQIGNRVLISHDVNIFDNDTHPIDNPLARHIQFKEIITSGHPVKIDLKDQPVIIDDDVLIGCQSIIMKGVKIGKGAVIGAGSIVNRNVQPYTLVAGNPARFVRKISRNI